MTRNPILNLIMQARLGYRAFSVLYDCPISSLRNTLYGYVDTVPRAVFNSLKAAGVEFEEDGINKLYKQWLKENFSSIKDGAQNV